MTLRLLLLRHAKASWDVPGLADADRPLAERGFRDAALMAEAIAARGWLPARIVCSTALRTRQTLAALLPHLPAETDIRLSRTVYDDGDADYLPLIAETGGDVASLMVIGHNPATAATASSLAGSGDAAALATLRLKFPTGALAVLDFDAPAWNAVRLRSGRLVQFLRPRMLASERMPD